MKATPGRQAMREVSIIWLPQSFETLGYSQKSCFDGSVGNWLAGVGTGKRRLSYLMNVIVRQVEGDEIRSGWWFSRGGDSSRLACFWLHVYPCVIGL